MKKVLNHPVIGLIMFCLFGVVSLGLAMILFDSLQSRYIFGWCAFAAASGFWLFSWYKFYQAEKQRSAEQLKHVQAQEEAPPLKLVS